MKSIVVYKIIIVIGALILATGLTAQKPTIDLITSHQQHKHPEAIIDTGYAKNPLIREPVLVQAPPVHNQNLTAESDKKRRRQIGPSLDSIFQKKDSASSTRQEKPAKISLKKIKLNPIKILIYIIALK